MNFRGGNYKFILIMSVSQYVLFLFYVKDNKSENLWILEPSKEETR